MSTRSLRKLRFPSESFSYKYYILVGLALALVAVVIVMFFMNKPESYSLKGADKDQPESRNVDSTTLNTTWNVEPLFWQWDSLKTSSDNTPTCTCRHCKRDYHQQCGL